MLNLNELIVATELGLIYGIVAIGIYLTFRVLDFPDLTCDGSFTLGAAVSIVAIKSGIDAHLSLVLSLIAGSLSGLLTGIIHIYCRVSNLLSGILVAFMLYSINLRVMGNIPNISLIDEYVIGWCSVIGIVILVYLTCVYIIYTDFGLSIRAIGQNKKICLAYGVQISFFTTLCLMLSNAFIALSGGMLSQYQNFVDVSQGIGTIIIALGGIIIGEKLLPWRGMWIRFSSCIVGSIIYRWVILIALHSDVLGMNTTDLNLITGVIIIIFMNIKNSRSNIC